MNSAAVPDEGTFTIPDAFLFEVSWEVCNQVGGIYTVIKTKVPAMVRHWGEHYCVVGPYNPQTAAFEFEPAEPPPMFAKLMSELEKLGVRAHFGRWLTAGRPFAILLDYRLRFVDFAKDKYFLWQEAGISTDNADAEVNEIVAFGSTVFELFRAAVQAFQGTPLVGHFHEWMAGIPIPRIVHNRLPVSTVFTTHATLLGRYIASDNPNFYREIEHIDPDSAAHRYNITARFQIERAAAKSATVFTTISEVTAQEATRFLGRKPDHITPNGINVQRFAALHEFQNLHLKYKDRINEFVLGHFFPSYTFDLDRTLYLFVSGRYEYRNKGIDLFIESLYRLNFRLKELTNPPNVVAFIITKAPTKNVNVGTLQNHLMFDDLRTICNEIESGMGPRILASVARGTLPTYEDLLSNDFQVRLKRAMHALKKDRLPAIVTHDMADDANDAVLRHLRHRHLFNQPGDPVKVVFHPEFVTATSPLFGLDYDQFVRGCHMGVFPSYYEPWGYTPLECTALGIPAVTTDLSGFGRYVQRHVPAHESNGIHVLNRSQRMPEESINELTVLLYNFVRLSRRERIEMRNKVERLSELFDWSVLSSFYHLAHDQALAAKT